MKKIFIISTLLTALLFSSMIMAQQHFPAYRKIGPVYLVNNPYQSQSVLFVAEYKNGVDNSWHYFLQLNAVKDNKELSRKEIAVMHDKPLEHEQIIGRLGNTILIVADSLVGYDVYTLEPTLTESMIIAANPFMTDNISRHHYSYLLDEAAEVMYMRDQKGDNYKLYPGSMILKPDDGNNERAPEEYSYEIAANYKLYDRCEMKSILTCIDTSDNNFYILGNEKETGYVLSYFGTAIYPEREENRQVTIVPYHADGEKLDYKKNPPKTGKASYFKGGFLENKFCTTAWKSKKGERLILFQSNGIKPTLSVALIDKEGKEKWKTNTLTAVNYFIDYLVADNNLLLWFNIVNNKSNLVETRMINVELETGSIINDIEHLH